MFFEPSKCFLGPENVVSCPNVFFGVEYVLFQGHYVFLEPEMCFLGPELCLRALK